MMAWRVFFLASSLSLSACAGSFSSDLKHWDVISNGKLSDQYGAWASCIRESIGSGGSFATVLGRCEAQKTGSAWIRISYEEERRLINAAWFAYKWEEIEHEADQAEAITNYGPKQ